jgi:hypothetical protein
MLDQTKKVEHLQKRTKLVGLLSMVIAGLFISWAVIQHIGLSIIKE